MSLIGAPIEMGGYAAGAGMAFDIEAHGDVFRVGRVIRDVDSPLDRLGTSNTAMKHLLHSGSFAWAVQRSIKRATPATSST